MGIDMTWSFKMVALISAALFGMSGVSSARKVKDVTASDIVLFYAGGQVGGYVDTDYVRDYVSYIDRDGNENWLFTGFLLLQIRDVGENSARVTFTPGMKDIDGTYLQSATQADWMKLIDYYFSEGHCVDAIDRVVEEAVQRMGRPARKHQVIISIPDPMPYKYPMSKLGGTAYWGIVDGKVTDFSKDEDRFAACRWFVDEVISRFRCGKYKNVELAGFYWITEEAQAGGSLLPEISRYVHSRGYSLTWIPYFQAPGYARWKEMGFDKAWYQPNYFFYNVPETQLETACGQALANGMAMEMEFDERANAVPAWGKESLAYKLRAYMDAFKEFGPWEKCQLAYYQGTKALRSLKDSSDPRDIVLYQDLCDFIAKRPFREGQ